MTEWINWQGGECPVAGGAIVEVRFRSGRTSNAAASAWNWGDFHGDPSVIVAYRVISPTVSAADLAAKDAEIERLTQCLAIANAHHERFERDWYLRVDECERLTRQRNAAVEKMNADHAGRQALLADNDHLRAELAVAREALSDKQRKAMQEALEALQTVEDEGETSFPATVSCAITAIHAAIKGEA